MTTAIGSGLGLPAATYQQVDQSAVAPVQLTGKHGLIMPTLFGPTDQPYLIESVSAQNHSSSSTARTLK